MLARFAKYHRESSNAVEGVELTFEFTLGRAKVRGSIDRLEVDSDGKYFVVDFKTGKAITKKEAQENLQLACYQLAVVLNSFEKKFDEPEVSGSHLVFLGHETEKIAALARDPIDVPQVQDKLEAIAISMAASSFIARENEFCGMCPVKTSCPVHFEGKSVIG